TVPGLGTSFGRGGATTAQQDLANADCILIEGSSMAEAHPVGFRWVMKAQERGAAIIHVDPRFSRTSALADIWVPIRAGSDIAFLGGLVRHLIENDLFFRDYVIHYTNASCIRPGKNSGDLLCRRLDAAFEGSADHSNGRDFATAAWEHRTARRRNSSITRARFYPRLDRYSYAL